MIVRRAAAGYRVDVMAPTPGPAQILYDFERARHTSQYIVINTRRADFRMKRTFEEQIVGNDSD